MTSDGPIRTATLAELYVRQGHLDEAIAIYRRIVGARPDDAVAAARLAELNARAADGDHQLLRQQRVAHLKVLLQRVRRRRRRPVAGAPLGAGS